MSKVFNMVSSGGGKNISSIIITGLESTDTVTCTKDGNTYPATWDSTAQHWEIVGLPLGTFTITATNGTKTITETVLIDIAGVYEVEMTFILWLYKDGNEYEEVTGGWIACDKVNSSYTISSNTKNADNLLSKILSGSPTYRCAGFRTVNKIDFSGFNELHFMVSDIANTNINIGLAYSEANKTCEAWGINNDKIVIGDNVMDISDKTTINYVKFGMWTGDTSNYGSLRVTKVWLK